MWNRGGSNISWVGECGVVWCGVVQCSAAERGDRT
ncbi:hypothetical protein A2U01_0102847, partial [Trifolium medium]|nr:hypothetical protein [Trifolium medium]